ncbi:MAG: winged helix-turn-helix domain-containing protein [Tetrasphaera sp.]
MDRNLSDPARPFYGFFTTTKLAPFTVEQAQQMLQALARARGEDDLANELTTPRMRARVEAIAHLAGGQPRMWAVVSEGLDLEIHQLDRLVDLLLTRFDDLTPYYQERLARLAPQQRLVIIELAGADHPLHVAELARRLGIDQRSLGKTVTELNDAGWIAPVRTPITDMMDRRRTYYELSEPLLRIAFQIKDTRGEPLPMVIDFLKGWFDPNQLTQHRGSSPDQDVYLAQAVDSLQTDPLPHVSRWLSGLAAQRVPALGLLATIDDALHALNEGDADAFLALPVSLRTALETQLQASDVTATTSSLRAHIHTAALEEVGDTPTEEPSVDQEWIARAETLAALPGHTGLERLLGWLIHSWSFPEAKAVLYALTETLGPGHPVAFTARSNLAHATGQAGDPAAAVAGFEGLLHDAERVFGRDDC